MYLSFANLPVMGVVHMHILSTVRMFVITDVKHSAQGMSAYYSREISASNLKSTNLML